MFDLQPPRDDGLLTPLVKPWSSDKHYFLRRYIDAFTTAMKRKWELHYVDLFAGAGIEDVKGRGLDWGSPLIAAQAPHQFSRLHVNEYAEDRFNALAARLARFQQPSRPQLLRGDANQIVGQIVKLIPAKSLSLAFLDPYGLHLHYSTVRQLADRAIDLIIFFPDHIDALRNWRAYYADNPESNLDLVLGTGEWRERKASTPRDRWVDVLRQLYEEQLRRLGYIEFHYERICRPDGRHLYRLIFCSRHPIGGQIWTGTSSKKPDGQGHFPW
ncbi:MAG TPA: three-Cys-motif partner protein TcmP [Tepidisphaeraceae bacterium]